MNRAARRLLILIMAAGLPLAAVDPNLVNLSRPDVNFVLGVRVADISSSPLVSTAMTEAQRSSPDWDKFVGLLGPTPFTYLDEIVVSGKVDETGGDKEAENLLIVARGAFGDKGFSDMLCRRGCEPDEYREFEIVRLPMEDGKEPAYFAFLDAQYAALGKLEDVKGAIDRRVMETESVFNEAIRDGIDRLGAHHIWLAAKGSLQNSLGGEQQGAPMMAGAAAKIEGIGLGVTLGSDVRLALELRSYNEADAKQLYDMFNGFLALMKSGEVQPETRQMLDRLSLNHDGRFLAASLTIPEAEIRRQIEEKAAQMREQPAEQVTPAVTRRPPQPRRRKGGIRIYGLEEEPVEVPTNKPE